MLVVVVALEAQDQTVQSARIEGMHVKSILQVVLCELHQQSAADVVLQEAISIDAKALLLRQPEKDLLVIPLLHLF